MKKNRIPAEFRIEGQTIVLPDDFSHIPFVRRQTLKNKLRAAYPGPAARFFIGIFAGALTAGLFLIVGLFLWPLLLGVPIALIWGLGYAFGLIDGNRKSRDKLHAVLRDLYRDGYLGGATEVRE